MYEYARRILERFKQHPLAPVPPDPDTPATWAEADGDTWVLWIFPANELDEADRAFVWEHYRRAVADIVAMTLPEGVGVDITPPVRFPNGKSVEGIVRFTPDYAWEMISAKLPEASNLMNNRIARDWPRHLAEKRKHEPEHIKRARQRLARVQSVENARDRIAGRTPPPEQRRKGRSI